jgi:predicted signal transduction protein with EAL and GGDEF domain
MPRAQEAARRLTQRIMEALARPVVIGERAFTTGASTGVALFPATADTESDVLRHADLALYRAKSMGRGLIQFFVPNFQDEVTYRLRVEEGLRQAIPNGELDLYFQPQVDSAGNVTSAEALLRWHHPELGDVPPTLFIAIAEESGLIHAIGTWVFGQACARLTEWLRAGVTEIDYVSINVCPWQFARPDFVDDVRNSLAAHGVEPRRVMLELTETAFLYDLQETIQKLTALRALGIRIALDDFGTGYSSLAYLRELPLDQIKIDRIFTAELDQPGEHPLVESMIAIGQHMKLEVVAEGVETETQRAQLVKCGCERFQGYLFCHPLPEQKFLEWLSAKAVVEQI